MASKQAFTPPEVWFFPPFFSLQPTDITREEQLKQWDALLVEWLCLLGSREVPKDSYLTSDKTPMFYNAEINRQISKELFDAIIDRLSKANRVVRNDRSYYILSVPERDIPARIIECLKNNNYVADTTISVRELRSIIENKVSGDKDLRALPDVVLHQALKKLVSSKNIDMFNLSDGQNVFGLDTGIKLLAL